MGIPSACVLRQRYLNFGLRGQLALHSTRAWVLGFRTQVARRPRGESDVPASGRVKVGPLRRKLVTCRRRAPRRFVLVREVVTLRFHESVDQLDVRFLRC